MRNVSISIIYSQIWFEDVKLTLDYDAEIVERFSKFYNDFNYFLAQDVKPFSINPFTLPFLEAVSYFLIVFLREKIDS